MKNEQAGAGRDGRARLVKPDSQARTGTGKSIFSPVQLATSRIGIFGYIACTEQRENHGTMILHGVCYSAYTLR